MSNDNQAAHADKKGHEDRKAEIQGVKDEKLHENKKDRLDEKLDQAGEESFPASDPVSVKITK